MAIEETANRVRGGLARIEDRGDPYPCLLDVLQRLGDFRTFLRLADAAQVTEDLVARSPLTVLAPTDAALAGHEVEQLLAPGAAETLCDFVERHLVRGAVVLDQALALGTLVTIDGGRVDVRERDGAAWLQGARLERAPLVARNGVVFILDRPLPARPRGMAANPPSHTHTLLAFSRPAPSRAGGAREDAMDGARALLSLAPSKLQSSFPSSFPSRFHARELEQPRLRAAGEALDHGRTALLALPPSKLRHVAERETSLPAPGRSDGLRSR